MASTIAKLAIPVSLAIAAGVAWYNIGHSDTTRKTDSQSREIGDYWGDPEETGQTPLDDAASSIASLSLRGTTASGDNDLASALIDSGNDGNAQLYRVGDRLPGGGTLRSVSPGSIAVETANGVETIVLSDAPASANPPVNRGYDSIAAANDAVGLWDGEVPTENQAQNVPVDLSLAEPPRRTRNGPVLSEQMREEAESLALED